MQYEGSYDKAIAFLRAQATEPDCVWSVATFGAIAEYHGTRASPVSVSHQQHGLTLTSDQGAMQVTFHSDMRLVAYEGLSKIPTLWSQGVSLCLPADQAQMRDTTEITVLGPDRHAIRPQDQDMHLFDLGLGASHMDACVRTDDEDLIDLFEEYRGMQLFVKCHKLVEALLDRSPTRVFSSALARIEVHTPIPSSDGETPDGAHTHVLPQLLALGRSHATTVPIPEGWLPALNLFPANPARNASGNEKEFDLPTHQAFQTIMADFADPEAVALKTSVEQAVLDGHGPDTLEQPESRNLRTALRIALRQLRYTHGPSQNLDAWLEAFEHNNENVDE